MLLDHHRAKIVQPEVLESVLHYRPEATTVLCHGVFDVVHPGHLRHLCYAKSKADVLICSITSDAFADKKGQYRPHVPQDLRAASLALLDIVDYVVINNAPDPVALITLLQPNFYAKGFEYSDEKRTVVLPEAEAVQAYGGQILFTPGDVVYSSSEMINAAAPDLRWDKLADLMRRSELTFDVLRYIVRQMKDQSVHVVGDLIVDRITHCEVIGTSGKTPTLSVRRDRSEDFVGGAGVVAKHVQAAGADVCFTTVTGNDLNGTVATESLEAAGMLVRALVDTTRPTTTKEVVVAGGYRLLKVDDVDSSPVSPLIERQVLKYVQAVFSRAVIFSDFRHGIFNARSIPALAAAIPKKCLRVADSQVASRWGNITDFKDFDLITPNEREARFALGDQDSGVRSLAERVRKEAEARWLLMKVGARGVFGFGVDGEALNLDAFATRVTDPVGAGDAFLAYATLSLLVRPSLAAAAILGSFAAGAECEYEGNVPVTAERVLAKIDEAAKEIG
jgi:rfaE bifunctional protein kinase chain/domain